MSNIRSVMNHPNYNKVFRRIRDSIDSDCKHPVSRIKGDDVLCMRCGKILDRKWEEGVQKC